MTRWITGPKFKGFKIVEPTFYLLNGLEESMKIYVDHKQKELESTQKLLQKEARNIKKK